ncbi:MAG: hypothetical protein HZA48_05530 [Planctomycetes bacterium]|nr:hypothetical protein [Planctomycetota bacterium]
MKNGFLNLILRNPEELWSDVEGTKVSSLMLNLTGTTIVASFIYGAATGCYVGGMQILITGCKIPVLFLGTLLICSALIYMISRILVNTLTFYQSIMIPLISITITSVILAAWAPVVLLFSVSLKFRVYSNYVGLVLLLTFSMATAGIVSIWYLYRGVRALVKSRGKVVALIFSWIIIYQFVCSQFAWILRPFVGSSSDRISFEGNFYEAVPLLIKKFIENAF